MNLPKTPGKCTHFPWRVRSFPFAINVPDGYPNQEGFIYQTEAVHRCLAAGLRECPQINQQESLNNVEVLESILALREGSAYPVPSKSATSDT